LCLIIAIWRNVREWGRVTCIRNPGTTHYSKMSHQFYNLDALLPQKELLVSIRMGFRAGLDRRLMRKVAASVTKWNHADDTDSPDLKEFLIYSEALLINLNGETKIMPFKIIFNLSWFYLNGISYNRKFTTKKIQIVQPSGHENCAKP